MTRHRHRIWLVPALVSAALLAAPGSALAAVPGEVDYQGLLLDSSGEPVNGMVDFEFRLYDAAMAGMLLWTETRNDVEVLDGVYDVSLGATTPLSGVLGGGAVYLEVEVDGETLDPRQRLLAVPYALRAETADAVDGLASAYFTELIEHVNLDGGGPPNLDPSEGTGDPDGDGIANFVDPDNDDDTLSDIDEVAAGSDINLVTPIITGFDPPLADVFVTTTIDIQGANFDPAATLVFGTESPVPNSVTPTNIEVDVGPQAAPGLATVTVTNPNGESANGSFPFFLFVPVIDSIFPPSAKPGETTLVSVFGQDFVPPMTVSFGTLTPTPFNETSTSFQVNLGPNPGGDEIVSVTVTSANGESDTASFEFDSDQTRVVFVTSTTMTGNLGGAAGADAVCAFRASTAGLSGTFVAWIADASTDPDARFVRNGGPYVLTDGTQVAASWTDLTDGSIAAPIDRTESNSPVAATGVWTGAFPDGTGTGGDFDCNDWTNTAIPATAGATDETGTGWSNDGLALCSGAFRLFCFEN